jgi:hypothetical protein
MIPSGNQFSERRAQIDADAEWARNEWEAKGGDKAAHTFKPDFKGQSYEQQMRDKKK